MSIFTALGTGLPGIAEGLDSSAMGIRQQQALNMRQQQVNQNIAQQRLGNLQGLSQGMLLNGEYGQAASMMPALAQAYGNATGAPFVGPRLQDATQTVEGPMPPGQYGPGAPIQQSTGQPDFATPQARANNIQAMETFSGLRPQVQILKGSYGTPSQAIYVDPITHQVNPVWTGTTGSRGPEQQAQADYLEARAKSLLGGGTPDQIARAKLYEAQINSMQGPDQTDPYARYWTLQNTPDGKSYRINTATGQIVPVDLSLAGRPGQRGTTGAYPGQGPYAGLTPQQMQATQDRWHARRDRYVQNAIANRQRNMARNGTQLSPAAIQQITTDAQTEFENHNPEPGAHYTVQRWLPLIDKYAQQYNVDPLMVQAVLSQESGGNPFATDVDGPGSVDRGLMQISSKYHPDFKTPWDPEENIAYGAQFLSGLLRKSGGNYMRALQGYNGGPTYANTVMSAYRRLGGTWGQPPATSPAIPAQPIRALNQKDKSIGSSLGLK